MFIYIFSPQAGIVLYFWIFHITSAVYTCRQSVHRGFVTINIIYILIIVLFVV